MVENGAFKNECTLLTWSVRHSFPPAGEPIRWHAHLVKCMSCVKKVKVNKSPKIIVVVSIVAVVCLGLFVLEAQTKVLRHTIDNIVYDNKNHYLPCEKLPTEAEVRKIVQEHQDVIQAIEQVNPGFVGVEIDTSCAGKADLLIWYASHENRLEIEKIIGGDTFLGVPYRLNNR